MNVDVNARRGAMLGGALVVVLAIAAPVAWLAFGVPVGRWIANSPGTLETWARNVFETLEDVFTPGFISRSIRMAAPITLVAVGGLYAEKSGVFNIGLEGFMIFGAFFAAAGALFVGGNSALHAWTGIAVAVLLTTVMSVVFAVLLLRYEADQIVAGLGVWFIALGLAPFTGSVIWGSRNSDAVPDVGDVTVPVLADVPYLGEVVFNQSPLVWLTVLVVLGSWVLLYRTKYGYWIQAAGENPEALDTAGVNVNRVRYATVIVSGALAGLGGAVLLTHSSSFTGGGQTMVDGRGWLGIVAYLFGNYNPLGAAAAALLFGGVDQLQGQLQTIGIDVSSNLLELLPYLAVLVVLTGWGRTRVPSSVGEVYESED